MYYIGDFKENLYVYKNEQTETDAVRSIGFCVKAKIAQTKSRGIWCTFGTQTEQFKIIVRKDDISLRNTFSWNGLDLWPHSITEPEYGFNEILACRVNIWEWSREGDGFNFWGALSEKYIKYTEPQDPYSEINSDLILVTPKSIKLRAGDLILSNNLYFNVHEPHFLDPDKNEYEIQRVNDV